MKKEELFTEVWQCKQDAEKVRAVLAARYERAYGMYRGVLPKVKKEGDLPATRVMWESFESIYPSLVALFTDSKKAPVAFDSDSPQSGKIAAAVTRAVHTAAMKVNNSYKLYMAAIKEMLIAGNQVALVGYDEKTQATDKYSFTDAPIEDLMSQAQALSTAGYNIEHSLNVNEKTRTATGWIKGKHTYKYPVISLVDFKNFLIHPDALDIETSQYTGYSEDLTVAEGIERGWPEEKLIDADNVSAFHNADAGLNKQLIAVNDMATQLHGSDSSISLLNNRVTIHHHYWRGCYDSRERHLWYVITNDAEIIHVERVDYCPLVLGGMSIVPGSLWSESLYDFCANAQIAKTRAMRAIQRTADGAAYGEYVYIKESLTPAGRAAFSNRGPGGAYEAKSQNAITRLPANDVSNAMQMLNAEIQAEAEKVVQGSAGQAQALEKDAKASGTAIALTQDKQELNENQIAKCIAETFIKPLYKILLLVLQETGGAVDIEGVQVPYNVLNAAMGISIDVETAYDRAKAASNVLNAYNTGAQLGTLPPNITDENKYNIHADFFRVATGQEDVSRWITPTEEMPQPSKPAQLMQAFMAIAGVRQHIAQTKMAEAKMEGVKAETQKHWNEALLDLAKIKETLEGIDIKKITLAMEAQKNNADIQNDKNQTAIDAAEVANKTEPEAKATKTEVNQE
ncbi:portal protein [Buttiauxella brennerae]|uniref:portal protein n=1 Tax=Buttiauxella brennerae TaxID=82988 RepID=UPI00286FACB9|nr:hypothetical protein [Buttiauxella brennerae]